MMAPKESGIKPMESSAAPKNANDLQRRLSHLATARKSTVKRLQSLVGNIVLCQMLPPSAVKGGTGLKLRLGDTLTRQTPDLDTAFRGNREEFEEQLQANLAAGWGEFTGTVVAGTPRAPASVPKAYVMQPFEVKLQYRRRPFLTVDVELGYDELEATTDEELELELSQEVVEIFASLGLQQPNPVAVLPLHHQISQKLHACTEPGSQRAHDLVDLQLVASMADDAMVAKTVERLFRFRRQHDWPARVEPGPQWDMLYKDAALGLEGSVCSTVEEAAAWLNDRYIPQLLAVSEHP